MPIFTKFAVHYDLLQNEVLCLQFGKSQVSHTAVNTSVSQKGKITNQTAISSVITDNSCKRKGESFTDKLRRESLAAQELITNKNSSISFIKS